MHSFTSSFRMDGSRCQMYIDRQKKTKYNKMLNTHFSCRVFERHTSDRIESGPWPSGMGRSHSQLRKGTATACGKSHFSGASLQFLGATDRMEVHHLPCGSVSKLTPT